jgi:undecaprenyl pyrophosphate phosphatase UppP
LALLFLAIFDAFHHSTAHWSLTVVFIVCVALSAIFQTLEIFYLKQDHPDRNHLRRNALIKIIVVGLAVIVAICFGASTQLGSSVN